MSDKVVNINDVLWRRAAAADAKIKRAEGDLWKAWQDLGTDLLELRDRYSSDQAFGDAVRANGIDRTSEHISAAMWVARLDADALASAREQFPNALHPASLRNRARQAWGADFGLTRDVREVRTQCGPANHRRIEQSQATMNNADKGILGRRSNLERQHGEAGKVIATHITALSLETGKKPQGLHLAAKLSSAAVKGLADLIDRYGLPDYHFTTTNMDANLLWRQMPKKLSRSFHRGTDSATIIAACEAWETTIQPVYEAWQAAGRPEDSGAWYADYLRKTAPAPIAPVMTAPSPKVPPEQQVKEYEPAVTTLNPHFRPDREGDIVFLGKQFWPARFTPDYSYGDLWYALQFWLMIEKSIDDPDPKSRATRFSAKDAAFLGRAVNRGFGNALHDLLSHQAMGGTGETKYPPYRLSFR